jgi:hypothetical protein
MARPHFRSRASHCPVSPERIAGRWRLEFFADQSPDNRHASQSIKAEQGPKAERHQGCYLQANQRREHRVTLVPPHVRAQGFVFFDEPV